MKRLRFDRLTDETIDHVLLYLRAEIIREGLDNLECVDALLDMRAVDVSAYIVPQKRPKHFKRNQLRREILSALRSGPLTGPEIARAISTKHAGLTYKQAYKRVYIALDAMQERGLVGHEGRVWLAP